MLLTQYLLLHLHRTSGIVLLDLMALLSLYLGPQRMADGPHLVAQSIVKSVLQIPTPLVAPLLAQLALQALHWSLHHLVVVL